MKSRNLKILKEHGFNVPEFETIKWEDKDKIIDDSKYNGKYAIRSSSYLEDGINDSFAGQFDTYLNVSPNNINKKVKECFNSINNKNVKEYLIKKKIPEDNIKMDVIIQNMVDSDLSGVLFTSNPQGIINETVIVVGKGLGNKIVEDKTDTTTYFYNTTDKKYYFEGKKDLLKQELIEELINQSNKVKDIFGEYLDIEYAIENNKIYILQVRPITTIKDNNIVILDNSNIVESYPKLSLPLTISFVKMVYSGVFKSLSYRITKDKKLIKNNKEYFDNMVGNANGRLYYKISNWYGLLKTLPFNKKIIPVWQDMLGVRNKSINNKELKISLFTRIKSYFNIFFELKSVSKNMNNLNDKFKEINDYFYKNFKKGMDTKEIIKLYLKIKNELLNIWDITLINDLYAFIYTGLLKKRLLKKNYSEEKTNDYISGISNIESLKPIKELVSLAYKKDTLTKSEYKLLFDRYIFLYGDRNLEELKLESETFRTNPTLLENKIKEYQKDPKKLENIYKSLNKDKKINIKEDFLTNRIAKKAMKGIENREISRLNRSRIYGMVRSMFIEIGNNLVKEKRIKTKEDIFYLQIDEIFNSKTYDLNKIVLERKKEYKMFEQIPSYSRLVFIDKEFDKQHRTIENNNKRINKDYLKGTPTSNGIVEGYVQVIDDINTKYDVKDKILVTKMTDPGWVFLIALAKGIIAEKGSILSHTAIISRELKIPSIVGVEDATSILNTGDYIKMNAETGKIEILKRRTK